MRRMQSEQQLAEAAVHYRSGRLELAEAMARSQIRGSQGPPEAFRILGLVAMRREDADEALDWLGRGAIAAPGAVQFPYMMGKACAMAERYDDALGHYDRALAIDSGHAPSLRGKSVVLERTGDAEGALEALGPILAGDSVDDESMLLAARAEHGRKNFRGVIEMASDWLGSGERSVRCRQQMGYLIGQAHDRLGEYDEAFAAFASANGVEPGCFDIETFRAYLGELRDADVDGAGGEAGAADARGRMVYIAGMPRSGTTLIESILHAHPEAHGLGENGDLHRMLAEACGDANGSGFPEGFGRLSRQRLDRLARRYAARQAARAPGARRIVNKHLKNWHYLGAIARVAPGSRVIWVHRDPRDNCVSMYTQHFNLREHGYSTDLRALGAVHREHVSLMRHWMETLDLPILEVAYEDLVGSPDVWMRRIVEFAGLPWDDRCAAFHTASRVVRTLSYDQVRQPIFTSSVGRWERYRAHLGPLLDELDGGASGPEESEAA